MMSKHDKLFIEQDKIEMTNSEKKWAISPSIDGLCIKAAKSKSYEEEIEDEDYDDEDFDDEDFDDDDLDDDDFDDEFDDDDLDEDDYEEDKLFDVAL
jgi:hypothetical protein